MDWGAQSDESGERGGGRMVQGWGGLVGREWEWERVGAAGGKGGLTDSFDQLW